MSKTNKIVSKNKQWHKQQENILKKWSEIGSSYRFMHDRSYLKYQKRNMRFALPVIVISTVTGTANFAQSSFPPSWSLYVPLIIGFFNLLAGLITTIAHFLRVSELLEGHRSATIAYSKLSRNISVELSLPRNDRSSNGTDFVNLCRVEMDRLIEQSPNISLEIMSSFSKKFSKHKFKKPEILNIEPVNIYLDDEKELLDLKLEKIKKEEEAKREIINTDNLRRKTFIREYEEKSKSVELTALKLLENKKRQKKDQVTASSISGGLNKLMNRLQRADYTNDMITPESSEAGEQNIIIDVKDVSENINDALENTNDALENTNYALENTNDALENTNDALGNTDDASGNMYVFP